MVTWNNTLTQPTWTLLTQLAYDALKSHINYIYKHTKSQPNISIKIESQKGAKYDDINIV
jgi:hypothetical protein